MDLATESLNAILHGPNYEAIELPIPLFDEHKEYDRDGRLLRNFTPQRLQHIVNVCNARRRTADLSPIGPGHTISDIWDAEHKTILYKAKETDQPPIYGYVGEFKLGRYGPGQKPAIMAKFYMKRRIQLPDGRVITGKEALEEFPRRSIELWYDDSLIDWVALLRRSPQRDLGTTAAANSYEKLLRTAPWNALKSQVYGTYERTNRLACAFTRDGKLRYEMTGDTTMPEDFDPTTGPDANAQPAAPPTPAVGAGGLPPEEGQKAMAYFKHGLANHPVGKYMCKYAADNGVSDEPEAMPPAGGAPGGAPPEAPGQYDGAGMPSATNAALPGSCPPEPDKMHRNGTPERYAAENVRLRSENEQMARRLVYAKDLQAMQEVEGYEFDLEEELKDCIRFDRAGFDQHMARIRRLNRSPVGGGFINPAAPNNGVVSQAKLDERLNYMRRNGVSYEKATEACK